MTATNEMILSIEARGEIIHSNFPAFAEMVRARLGEINRELATDEDFDQADQDAKAIAGAEASLKAAKEKALADAEQLHALFEGIDGLSNELARARLDLSGQIKKRKEELKAEIVEEFLGLFDIDPMDARRHFLRGLQEATKGKRTVESMRTACRVYQASQQASITESRAAIERFVAKFGSDLVMDRRELELKNRESVEAELVRRHESKKAADEAAKLRAEVEAAKAEVAKAQAPPVEPEKPVAPAIIPRVEPPVITMTAEEEWKTFKAACLAAFKPLKTAREGLAHSKNVAKAQGFAAAINAAWGEWV